MLRAYCPNIYTVLHTEHKMEVTSHHQKSGLEKRDLSCRLAAVIFFFHIRLIKIVENIIDVDKEFGNPMIFD